MKDPQGLDKDFMLKLVKQKCTIANYKGTISQQGYLINVNDRNIELPDGTFGKQYS